MNIYVPSRRAFLRHLGLGAAFFATPGAFAEALTQTPKQTEGPFYPDKLPLDTDNDLLAINDALTPAVGEVTYVSGRILDAQGGPIDLGDGKYEGIADSYYIFDENLDSAQNRPTVTVTVSGTPLGGPTVDWNTMPKICPDLSGGA